MSSSLGIPDRYAKNQSKLLKLHEFSHFVWPVNGSVDSPFVKQSVGTGFAIVLYWFAQEQDGTMVRLAPLQTTCSLKLFAIASVSVVIPVAVV